MSRKKKKELSVTARKRGFWPVVTELYDVAAQTCFLVILVMVCVYVLYNATQKYLIEKNNAFQVFGYILLPENDPDIQGLRSLLPDPSILKFDELSLKAIEASFLGRTWIDQVSFTQNENQFLEISIERKLPVCKTSLSGSTFGLNLKDAYFVDDKGAIFQASSQGYMDSQRHLPYVKLHGATPLTADSNTSPILHSVVEFITDYNAAILNDSDRKFRIQSITYINDSYTIVLENDSVINIIHPDLSQYTSHVIACINKEEIRNALLNQCLIFDNAHVGVLKEKLLPEF